MGAAVVRRDLRTSVCFVFLYFAAVVAFVVLSDAIGSSGAVLAWHKPSELDQLSCISALACYSTGQIFGSGNGDGEVVKIGARSIETVALGAANVTGFTPFDSISCPTSTWCMAVGQGTLGHSRAYTSEVLQGGAWRTMAGPANLGGGSLSCGSPQNCLDVATISLDGPETGPVEFAVVASHWDGTSWHRVPIPGDPLRAGDELSVSCIGNTMCVVAGPHAYVWDGHSMRVVDIRAARQHAVALSDAQCMSVADCTVIGGPAEGGWKIPVSGPWFVWTIDGTHLALKATVPVIRQTMSTSWIDCPRLPTCILVGEEIPPDRPARVNFAAYMWTGAKWVDMHFANQPWWHRFEYDQIRDLACTSTVSCFVVGFVQYGQTTDGFVDRWDGSRWSIVYDGHGRHV